MAEISRVALFGKLNSLGYKAVEGATVFCKLRGNPYVELEHWVSQIIQTQDSDLHRIVRHFGIDSAILAKDITAALDRLPRVPLPFPTSPSMSQMPCNGAGSMPP